MTKTIKKMLVVVMTLAMVISMAPTVQTDAATKKQVKSVKVTNVKKKKLTLKVGQSKKLKVKVKVKGKASKKVTFKSSNKKVATVSKKGVVKAKKVGKAKITVKSKANKKKKVVIRLTVKKATAVNKPQETTKPAVEETTKPAVEETTKPSTEETTKPSTEETTTSTEETTTPSTEVTTKPGKIETTIDTSSKDFDYDAEDEEACITCKVTFEKAGIYSITMNDELLEYDAEIFDMYSESFDEDSYVTDKLAFINKPGEYIVEIWMTVDEFDLETIQGMPISITFEENENNYEENSTEIELNTPIEYECTEENECSYYKFTAPEDGVYYFYTKSNEDEVDTVGVLIDSEKKMIVSDDTYESHCGFTAELKAGETVYFGVMGYDEEEAGNIVEVWVSDVEPEVDNKYDDFDDLEDYE